MESQDLQESPLPQSKTLDADAAPLKKSQAEEDLDLLAKGNPAAPAMDEVFSEDEELTFKTPLDAVERKHFQTIVKTQKEAIKSLRKQLQDALKKVDDLESKSEL